MDIGGKDRVGLQRCCLPLYGENLCSQSSVFHLVSTVKDNKKSLFKYVNSKVRIRVNVGPLLDEVGHLTSKDIIRDI